MNLTHLPVGPHPPEVVNAIVEIPKGGRNKYEYDAQLGVFRLDRVLYSAVHYPAAYGFIPSTEAVDGDPVDILVMTTEPTFTGCLIEARPVGLLRMRDEKGEDEKILAVPTVDPLFQQVQELADLPPHFLQEVEHFFQIYKELERKLVQTFGWESRASAYEAITAGIRKGVEKYG
jgi:inorganic pyrophosphatase